jgi:hypothetical protein
MLGHSVGTWSTVLCPRGVDPKKFSPIQTGTCL